MTKIGQKETNWLLRDKYQGKKTRAFLADLERLKNGEPLDYVIGWRDFLGCRIDLSERPLIPRVETEFWTEQAIKKIKTKIKKSPLKVLDIFSGSGCVGLAVIKHCTQTHVTFADDKEKCLKQIKKNLNINNIERKKVSIKKSDIFFSLSSSARFDFILANPPYVPMEGKGSRVEVSTKKFEPAVALWSGDDGLDIIRRFLMEAKNYLAPGGEIWLEFGYGQKTKLEKIIQQNHYCQWNFHRDQFGRFRFVTITF
jgi:release factor glutamine methyltransferase